MMASNDAFENYQPYGQQMKGIFSVVDGERLICVDYNGKNVKMRTTIDITELWK